MREPTGGKPARQASISKKITPRRPGQMTDETRAFFGGVNVPAEIQRHYPTPNPGQRHWDNGGHTLGVAKRGAVDMTPPPKPEVRKKK